MEFKNYDTLEYEKMEIISKLNLYDAYISVGVNKTDVGYIRPLTVNCGYSMGGQTKLFVNKKEVTTFSNEQEYSHSNRLKIIIIYYLFLHVFCKTCKDCV